MRRICKAVLLLLSILAFVAVGAVVKRLSPERGKGALLKACSRTLLRIVGVSVEVRGASASARPLLLVSNHSSYLDIYVLGGSVPVRYTPKAEIAGWPVIGSICRLLDCVFIDRRPGQTAANRDALRAALEQGAVISLFPEGTTSNGKCVLPFRSSYFSLAAEEFAGKPLAVQPACITYTHLNGMPIDCGQRPKVAWYGDMDLVPHVSELLKLGHLRAQLTFFEPVDIRRFADRKALAAHCEQVIAAGMQAALHGGRI